MDNRLYYLCQLKKPILVCYLPIGDPALHKRLGDLYASCGVNIFEIGVPSKNPYLDGQIIKESMERVLDAEVTIFDIGREISRLRGVYPNCATVVMGYAGTDIDTICESYTSSIDGRLIIGETDNSAVYAKNESFYDIVFVSHAMKETEIDSVTNAKGYIMLQAVEGKTGMRTTFNADNGDKIRSIKDRNNHTPVLLGFGISTAEQACAAIKCGADGVIIGSACIEYARQGEKQIKSFLLEVRGALDDAS